MTSQVMLVSAMPSVSLSEVLHLALPSGSDAITSSHELSRRVHWARLLRARPTGAVEPGELLILPPALLETLGEPRLLLRLIGELIEAGAPAFVVSGDPPAPLVEACQSGGTPLLRAPSGAPLSDIERAIVGLILDRDGQLRRRAEEVYGTLVDTMLANAGLSALVDALASATGLRAAVVDEYLSLAACSPNDPEFERALLSAVAALPMRDTLPATGRPRRPLALRFRQVQVSWSGQLYTLQIGEAWAGYLGLLGGTEEVGELERLLADRATSLVALELAKQRAVAEATQRSRGEFLDDLLEGNFPTEEALLARGRQLGYDLQHPHVVLVIAADPPPLQVLPRGPAPAVARRRRRLPDIAGSALRRLEPDALAVEREGRLVALLPVTFEDQGAPRALAERVRASVAEALPELGVSAGVSRLITGPTEVPRAESEATQALGIGQRLLGARQTVDYARLGVERLLYHLIDHADLARFAQETLGSLIDYDERHRGELVRTVEVFLKCNGNHVRAAQELHLHRNTLLYRLERAREILERDLDDADARLAIQVALRARGAIATVTPAPAADQRKLVARRARSR